MLGSRPRMFPARFVQSPHDFHFSYIYYNTTDRLLDAFFWRVDVYSEDRESRARGLTQDSYSSSETFPRRLESKSHNRRR